MPEESEWQDGFLAVPSKFCEANHTEAISSRKIGGGGRGFEAD
jgi:hypothetical protein